MDRTILDKYRGRWVALRADGSVADDDEHLNDLLDRLEENHAVEVTVQRIPLADEPLFVGLR
jgi:hypothetical protein